MKWSMPYTSTFIKSVNELFDSIKEEDIGDLFPHQAYIREFMNNSPYRGILLYHGLGVGKTRSAIEISKVNSDRDVIVLLPASLKDNFVSEMEKNNVNKTFQFISYNGVSRKNIKQYTEETYFDNKLIIIDEVHNFISRVTGTGLIAKQLYQLLMNAKNLKIVALSGTPIINRPVELAFLLNLINGYIYTEIFKYSGYAGNVPALESELIEQSYISTVYVDTEEKTISITFVPDHFEKENNVIVKKETKSQKYELMIDNIKTILTSHNIKLSKKSKSEKFTLLPFKEDVFNELFIDLTTESGCNNQILFSRRIQGLVSYYESYNLATYPEQKPLVICEVPLSDTQFIKYRDLRIEEIKAENNNIKWKKQEDKQDVYKSGNIYKSFSRALCNFVFPNNIKRPYPSQNLMKSECDIDDEDNEKNKDEEDEPAVNLKTKKKEYETKVQQALELLEKNADKYLSDTSLKEYGPKMQMIIENINMYNGTHLVYSMFRNVEGLKILSLALNQRGFKQLSIKKENGHWVIKCDDFAAQKYIIFNDNREETNILLSLFNSDFEKVPDSIRQQLSDEGVDAINLNGEFIKLLMITQSGAEGISLKNVRCVHLMEPYWNNIRVQQVIGRAIRAGSHLMLPKKDRNVSTFLYLSVFEKQQKEHALIKSHDKGLTSDGYVYQIASRKSQINNSFLQLLKNNAIDCIKNKKHHGTKVQCFKPPYTKNNYVYYNGDYNKDILDKNIIRSDKKKKDTIEQIYKPLGLIYNGEDEIICLTNPTDKEKEKFLKKYNDMFNTDESDPVWSGIYLKGNIKTLIGFIKNVDKKEKKAIMWSPKIKKELVKKMEQQK